MNLINEYREAMLPKENESVGNLGDNAYVKQVVSKNEVIVSIPSLGWTFSSIVDRGYNGLLMAVKFS